MVRAEYLVGCDGGRSLIRKAAGIDFPGFDPSISFMFANVEMVPLVRTQVFRQTRT